jgi:hypothetical protein
MRKERYTNRGVASGGNVPEREGLTHGLPPQVQAMNSGGMAAGPPVRLVNISRAGALLESDSRLFSGAHICLKVNTADAMFWLMGRVLRSNTSTRDGHRVKYESAIAFEDDFVLLDEDLAEDRRSARKPAMPRRPRHPEESAVTGPAGAVSQRPGAEQDATILTEAFVLDRSGADMRRTLGLDPKHCVHARIH